MRKPREVVSSKVYHESGRPAARQKRSALISCIKLFRLAVRLCSHPGMCTGDYSGCVHLDV